MRYYIITGEPSGDVHAANLVKELKKIDSKSAVRAWGGDRLIDEDVSLAMNIKNIAFMGLWNVIINLRKIISNLEFCKNDILNFKPDALILVDYPGFNLKIAKFAKNNGIKVFYYIPPKIWAWNKKRINTLKNFVDYIIVIFPFEVNFYKNLGINVFYFGNPLIDEIHNHEIVFSLKSTKPIIALLPGSRKQEIEKILPVMLSTVKNYPKYQFVIAGSNSFSNKYYESFVKDKDVKIVFNNVYGLLSNSKFALVTSGTATLEAALFNVPQIVCYKTNWITYIFAKILVKIKYISLVNIILNRNAINELIQNDLNEKSLIKAINSALNEHDKILKDYRDLNVSLGTIGASKKSADLIYSFC